MQWVRSVIQQKELKKKKKKKMKSKSGVTKKRRDGQTKRMSIDADK